MLSGCSSHTNQQFFCQLFIELSRDTHLIILNGVPHMVPISMHVCVQPHNSNGFKNTGRADYRKQKKTKENTVKLCRLAYVYSETQQQNSEFTNLSQPVKDCDSQSASFLPVLLTVKIFEIMLNLEIMLTLLLKVCITLTNCVTKQ